MVSLAKIRRNNRTCSYKNNLKAFASNLLALEVELCYFFLRDFVFLYHVSVMQTSVNNTISTVFATFKKLYFILQTYCYKGNLFILMSKLAQQKQMLTHSCLFFI